MVASHGGGAWRGLGFETKKTECGVESGSSRSMLYMKGVNFGGGRNIFRWPDFGRRWGSLVAGRTRKGRGERENNVCVFFMK